MYTIGKPSEEDELALRNLKNALVKKTEHQVTFFDIVSVEKKKDKRYNVLWFGKNKQFLENYHDLIKGYFAPGSPRKSLLMLPCDELSNNGISGRHISFDCDAGRDELREVDISRCLSDESFLSDETFDPIERSDEPRHRDLWKIRILKKAGIPHSSFSKIEFSIKKRDFVAAIWVGYSGSVHHHLTDETLQLCLENFLWSYAVNSIASELIAETERQAIRSAISQVGARNGAHNIGSHVLNKLSDFDTLKKIRVNAFESYRSHKLKGVDKTILRQLTIFNNYVKCRMDYLNDLTYGVPSMQANKKAFAELFSGFDAVRLLLEYISGLSETFRYKIVFKENGELLTEKNDLLIALPNDVIGCQAFYNILENIIRNTAKHNQNKNRITIFTVNFKEVDFIGVDQDNHKDADSLYTVEICDNNKVKGAKEQFSDADIKQLALFFEHRKKERRHADIANIDWLVFCQNERLKESVLNSSNQLRHSSLGLLEMEASAAYLRKVDVVEIEDSKFDIQHNLNLPNDDGELNILKAFSKNECLGYRFYVLKPVEVLFIGDFSRITAWRKKELRCWGISLLAEDEFKEKAVTAVYNHQFLIYAILEPETVLLLSQNRTNLPVRIIQLNENEPSLWLMLGDKTYDFSIIEKHVWELWFEQFSGSWQDVHIFSSYSHKYHDVPGSYNICFVDHLDSWDKKAGLVEEKKINSMEALSSAGQRSLPGFLGTQLSDYLAQLRDNPITRIKLFEAAVTRVLVIDERIQRFAQTPYNYQKTAVPYSDIFAKSAITVPEPGTYQLDPDNFDQQRVALICNYITNELPNHQFVLIHFSIMERMFGNRDSNQLINEQLEEWSNAVEIVVTSGRGKPRNLTAKVRYLNLSPVLNVFMHARSKFAINYLLNQSRR
jgi:hypothetical protein